MMFISKQFSVEISLGIVLHRYVILKLTLECESVFLILILFILTNIKLYL